MFREIRREFVDSLKNKTWMDEKTKAAAAEKVRLSMEARVRSD